MKYKIFSLLLTLLIVSCGGGGGGGSSTPIQESSNSSSNASASNNSNTSDSVIAVGTSSSLFSKNVSSEYFKIDDSPGTSILIDGEELEIIGGKAVDGYLESAKVFIDENFNLSYDEGEVWGTTESDGSFIIKGILERLFVAGVIKQQLDADGTTLIYQIDGTTPVYDLGDVKKSDIDAFVSCWKKRPLVVQVPVGAVDSSIGVVEKEYEMILPPIEGFWNEIIQTDGTNPVYSSIIISPFSNFLSQAVIKGIKSMNGETELTLAEGCSSKGEGVASVVNQEVNQALKRIENNFGINYRSFLQDYVQIKNNSVIDEENAGLIAKWLPLMTALKYEISKIVEDTANIKVKPQIGMSEETMEEFLKENQVDEIDLEFDYRYTSPMYQGGWFYHFIVETKGSKLVENYLIDGTNPKSDGALKIWKCADGQNDCYTNDFSLDGMFNSAQRQIEAKKFIKSFPYDDFHPNINLSVFEDRMHIWDELYDYEKRHCTFSEVITFDIYEGDNPLARYRNSMESRYDGNDLDCAKYENSPKSFQMQWRHGTTNENGNTDNFYFFIQSDSVAAATHLDSKIVNPFENRKVLDSTIPPYLQEVYEFPWKFSQIEEIRTLMATKNPSAVAYFFLEINRVSGSTEFDSARLILDASDGDQDKLYLNNNAEISAFGKDARVNFYNLMRDSGGKIPDFAGENSP